MSPAIVASHPIRVRFAPSPTGFLHIGGARTALFNWLFARANGGKFLLRIEDTDRERSEERFTADILESLRWLGLDWDEEPVYQSKRLARHKEMAKVLLAKGLAYGCECRPEDLEKVKAQCAQEKRPYRYPGTCRTKGLSDGYALRVRVPDEGETGFNDLIRGEIKVPNKDIEDWVICRSDGNPTYNFVVVVDDHDQGITHVLRGEDHINNTPKQKLLFEAFGWTPPAYAHLPMILGRDKAKLSKRHGAASTLEYRAMGYLPSAMVNFLVRLGWSHGDEEIFTPEQLTKVFSIEHVGKANAIFNVEKLEWISGVHLRDARPDFLVDYLLRYFEDKMPWAGKVDRERLKSGVVVSQGKVKTLLELIDQLDCLFGEDPRHDVSKLGQSERAFGVSVLKGVAAAVQGSDFSIEDLEKRVRAYSDSLGEKFGKVAKEVRFALTGGRVSPGLFEMMSVQGKETVSRRIDQALKALGGA